jgi:hypothetical protein
MHMLEAEPAHFVEAILPRRHAAGYHDHLFSSNNEWF